MRCNLTDTVWQIVDKKILSIREVELIYFFFMYDGNVLMLGWNSLQGVVTDESNSDPEVLYGDIQERRTGSEIVAWRTGTEYKA